MLDPSTDPTGKQNNYLRVPNAKTGVRKKCNHNSKSIGGYFKTPLRLSSHLPTSILFQTFTFYTSRYSPQFLTFTPLNFTSELFF